MLTLRNFFVFGMHFHSIKMQQWKTTTSQSQGKSKRKIVSTEREEKKTQMKPKIIKGQSHEPPVNETGTRAIE
jgi:hypothetical protein